MIVACGRGRCAPLRPHGMRSGNGQRTTSSADTQMTPALHRYRRLWCNYRPIDNPGQIEARKGSDTARSPGAVISTPYCVVRLGRRRQDFCSRGAAFASSGCGQVRSCVGPQSSRSLLQRAQCPEAEISGRLRPERGSSATLHPFSVRLSRRTLSAER